MIGYHVTTERKLERYRATGSILPPVRFWPNLYTAEKWSKKTGRNIILEIKCDTSYPLPDHKPAHWTPEHIRQWRIENESLS